MKPNRLINEKSPYLLQHAYNPVDWYPWCGEAFEVARKLDKPIFLSIGYSTCHWCHVMERESFDDPEVADILNEVFVCIKVDREERPDIDAFYMKVCQIMTGSGGWPLTIIMTPEKKPFFAGTYFPKYTHYNKIGLIDLARNVQKVWLERRNDVENSAENLLNFIKQVDKISDEKSFGMDYFGNVFRSLEFSFDRISGGFGAAPKFPTPQNYLFLMKYYQIKREITALQMVDYSLKKMRSGGIFDQIGFGFHRYSTDSSWILPHFEKMLYDQATLLYTYTQAFRITKNELFLEVANEIVEYVFRELLFEDKAFFSGEDADSEEVEGKFYLFDYDELRKLIVSDFDLFVKIFNVSNDGNFNDPFGHIQGKNILHLKKELNEISQEEGLGVEELRAKVSNWRKVLFEYRNNRIKPFKDKKILTDWNGLMISALANYYSISLRKDVLEILNNYLIFLESKLLKPDGSLYHLYVDNESRVEGFLDDYAFTIFGLLEIFKNTNNYKSLSLAYKLLTKTIEVFWDSSQKAFLNSSKNSNELLVNFPEFFDGAIPSGNSVMHYVLFQFYLYTGDPKFLEIVYELEKSFASLCNDNPMSYNFFNFSFLIKQNHKFELVVVFEDYNDSEYKKYLGYLQEKDFPNGLIIFYNPNENQSCDFVFWKEFKTKNGRTTAYLCDNFACKEPFTNFEFFVEEFEKVVDAS